MVAKEAIPAAILAESADADVCTAVKDLESGAAGSIRSGFVKGAASDEGPAAANPTRQTISPSMGPAFASRGWRLTLALAMPPCLLMLLWWSWAMAEAWAGRPLPKLFIDVAGDGGLPTYALAGLLLVGSMLAGATLDGSATVAFPAATLAAGLAPVLARDFALMTNAVGLTAFAASLLLMGRRLEVGALTGCSAGAAMGLVVGMEFLAPRLGVPYGKMAFPAAWGAFAFALFLLNRGTGRRDSERVAHMGGRVLGVAWRPVSLLAAGFGGGLLTSVFGSGSDIAVFLVLTLCFRVSDEVAGPTSLAVMAGNAWVGVVYRQGAMGGAQEEAWRLFAACAPAVAVAMPLGFIIASRMRRTSVEWLVYLLAAAQSVAAWIVVEPWTVQAGSDPATLILTFVAILVGGGVAALLADAGGRKLQKVDDMREVVSSLEERVVKKVDEESLWPTTSFVLSVWRIPEEEGGEAAVQYV